MTREQAKQNLIAFGIAEPTEEAVTAYLNSIHGETEKWKTLADGYKAEADKIPDLTAKLNDATSKVEASQAEKKTTVASKDEEIENLKNDLSKLKTSLVTEKLNAIFTSKGMPTDVYADVIGAYATMEETAAIEKATAFVTAISDAHNASIESAKEAYKQELFKQTPNPGQGGSQNPGSDGADNLNMSEAAKYAQKYSQKMAVSNTNGQDTNAPVNF